ncbi:MAG: hypothetical protein Q9218_006338 [Villophora microphyllina]
MTSDRPNTEIAAHLSHSPPPDAPPKTEVIDTLTATTPDSATDPSPQTNIPPPTLPKPIQVSPDLNRPDSAYGGSGGTPSLASAESADPVETFSYDIPPNPLLQSQEHAEQSQPPQRLPTPPHSHPAPQHSQPTLQDFQEQFQQDPHLQPPLPDQYNPAIVDDSLSSYADSAYDDAASLNESITDTLDSAFSRYRWENGRRYHSYRDGAYWGPNDETHNDQQDIAHHAWRLALNNQLYFAPIHRPERILDVGTGTGIWAIEIAEMFPDAQVVGTDLSPIQPTWVPPNCIFEVDDVTMEWTFRKDSFDFIHSREMFGSIADWDEYFRQCYLHLKPGGWVEALERGVKPVSDDDSVGPDHFWTTWGDTVLSVGEMWGKGFNAWEILKEKMEAAGFVDVVQVPMKWPIGPWMQDKHMKELGMWNALRLDTGLEGYVMRLFTMAGGVSQGQTL